MLAGRSVGTWLMHLKNKLKAEPGEVVIMG